MYCKYNKPFMLIVESLRTVMYFKEHEIFFSPLTSELSIGNF